MLHLLEEFYGWLSHGACWSVSVVGLSAHNAPLHTHICKSFISFRKWEKRHKPLLPSSIFKLTFHLCFSVSSSALKNINSRQSGNHFDTKTWGLCFSRSRRRLKHGAYWVHDQEARNVTLIDCQHLTCSVLHQLVTKATSCVGLSWLCLFTRGSRTRRTHCWIWLDGTWRTSWWRLLNSRVKQGNVFSIMYSICLCEMWCDLMSTWTTSFCLYPRSPDMEGSLWEGSTPKSVWPRQRSKLHSVIYETFSAHYR